MIGSFFWPVILQLAGVIIIIAEIILPSAGLLSMLAAGLFAYSLYMVYTGISITAGMVFTAADIIIIPVLALYGLKILAKSPVTLRHELSRKQGVISQSDSMKNYKGLTGKAISDLRPSGVAVINGKRIDVVTRGDYIEKDSNIIVSSVTGNQIIVIKNLK